MQQAIGLRVCNREGFYTRFFNLLDQNVYNYGVSTADHLVSGYYWQLCSTSR